MASAQRVVQQRSFHRCSYRDVAVQVGIRTASIHYRFPTKADLRPAMLDHETAQFAAARTCVDGSGHDAADKLRHFAALFLVTMGRSDPLCPFCMFATAQHAIPVELRAKVPVFWLCGERWLAAVLREGAAAARFELVAASETVARIGALEGAMVTARTFEDGAITRQRRLPGALDRRRRGETTDHRSGRSRRSSNT